MLPLLEKARSNGGWFVLLGAALLVPGLLVVGQSVLFTMAAMMLIGVAMLRQAMIMTVRISSGGHMKRSHAVAIRLVQPQDLDASAFAAGSMAPKVRATCLRLPRAGRVSAIGRLEDARAILKGGRHPDRQCPLPPATGRPPHPVLLCGRQG